MREYKVDVIIPTLGPGEKFHKLMQMLGRQTYPIERILIMNTEKSLFPDQGYGKLPGAEVRHLSREEFDHGGTRDRAASLCDGELLLFMTQDAVPLDTYLIERLVAAFADPDVAASYARQLPDGDCGVVEQYTRRFNYPDRSSVKSKEDLPVYGIKTFFCSNVCAMYRKSVYDRLGGFEKHTIFNEDMIFAGKIIQDGGSIAYVAEAQVIHSHNYGNMEQLRRNFDLAVSQAQHPEIFSMAKSESEGMKLVKQTAAYLVKKRRPWLIAGLIVKSGFKLIGYRLGKTYKKLPRWLIMKLTMNRAYWK
ncbi:MAG: glycosyltransferase family A protein [Lachnospiraceae bacterium]|jgi:rhamnosyltransferase|nr:glycosyltransferase family A protein [Lachnospiraceae bacterium]